MSTSVEDGVSSYFQNETQAEEECATNLRRALLKSFIPAF